MQNRIVYGLQNKKIQLHYQPIVCAATRKVYKYEGLARLVCKNKGEELVFYPDCFINKSKEMGLYKKVTKEVVCQAIHELERNTDIFISVNLSMQDLFCDETRAFLSQKLKHTSKSTCNRLILEVTETESVGNNLKEFRMILRKIHKLGAAIAIDDFGSGYSNLSSLLDSHVSYIKLDGEIIKNINKDKNKTIVELVVLYANKYGIKIIAEHVETKEQAEILSKIGVDYLQGYYFSKPLPHLGEMA